MSQTPLKITALTTEQLTKLISNASNRQITQEQVATIASDAQIIGADGKINLLEYTAFVVKELLNGKD